MAENTEKGTEAKEGRKVFLSVLGTGFYYKCSYYTGDFKSATTRFIQRASLEYYGAKEWRSTDLVCFFLTEKAKRENWSGASSAMSAVLRACAGRLNSAGIPEKPLIVSGYLAFIKKSSGLRD